MAGEVAINGFSTQTHGSSPINFNFSSSLTSKYVIHGNGLLEFTIHLDFRIGLSNKMNITLYRCFYGESVYSKVYETQLNSTGGTTQTATHSVSDFASYILILEPVFFGVVQQVICDGSVGCSVKPYLSNNRLKLLRICNRIFFSVLGFYNNNISNDTILSEAFTNGNRVTTSVGTLIQSGQWIFGQN